MNIIYIIKKKKYKEKQIIYNVNLMINVQQGMKNKKEICVYEKI